MIYPNAMGHGKPSTTASTGGQKKASLILYSIGYFPFLMRISSSTGQLSLWMAAIFVQRVVLPVPKKHPDITSGHGLGRSRGGYGTKIHLATDGNGFPLNIALSAGQAHESQLALRLLDGIGVLRKNGFMKRRGKAVLADKAYSNKALRSDLKLSGIKVVIPYKSNEKASTDGRFRFDKESYRKRNVVERSFGLLKENRRIATRYEKTARNYLSMVQLGCIRLFLRRIPN